MQQTLFRLSAALLPVYTRWQKLLIWFIIYQCVLMLVIAIALKGLAHHVALSGPGCGENCVIIV
jgi:hypothetical protein